MGGVGGEVVLETLLVADVDEDVVEDTGAGVFAGGDGKSALEHVLEQADGFETDGLAAGVGAGDEEQASAIAEGDVEGNHLLAVALETLL